MNGTPKVLAGPAFLAVNSTDIYAPPASSVITLLRQIHLNNATNAAQTATVYRGATNGNSPGTALCTAVPLPANEVRPIYFDDLVMKSTDFLSGLASNTNSVTITVIGHQIVTP